MNHSDQQELMTENERSSLIPGTSKPSYIALRVIPLLSAFFLSYFHAPISISIIFVFIICFIDIYITKEHFGIGLVGLRWYRNKSESPKFPNIVYYSKPLPFVASTIDSNIFWLGLLLSPVGWIISAVFYCYFYGSRWLLICCGAAAINLMNFSAFMRCHNAGKEQADSIARTLLLDKNVSFQVAKEENELSSTSEEETEDEDEEDKTTVLKA
ncbi:hypothetical protein TRFO_13143 [Tritrichomonas foetus]|uniref:Golgi apparatus membrane protein TVP23 homolog n=1 Tax=Tritrichomonas foetus TaxID=1144522 RepID=A0A1J4L3J6_9EUKA|nr:hypothetical protein TRFO_13143 [Tritrichomonas foetus]|eukprot:OHT16548.1 hypothetical protein TRFO_13143 [Tritrichomonas foetus]